MSQPSTKNDPLQRLAHQASQKAWKADFMVEMDRAQLLARQHDLVGVKIAQALAQGEFDNLAGYGKPLDLADMPYDPDGVHMALKILKDNGFAPYWIELGKEIDALRKQLDKEVEDFKIYTQMVFGEKRSSGAMQRFEQKKQSFYSQVHNHLQEISKKILDYNLHCPVSSLGRFNFNVECEMKSIIEAVDDLVVGQPIGRGKK